MQKTIEAVFYQCEHTGAFMNGPAAVVNILRSHYGESCEAAPYILRHFSPIQGYRFIREGVTCFIPHSKTPPSSNGPFPFAPLLASKDLIVPPLLMPRHMMLICDAIRANVTNADGLTVDFCLASVYTPRDMGRYFESLFSKIDSFRPYMQHIDECIRAYLFGYVSVAVSGLILASEGILREIGANIDSRFEGITSKDQFTNVLTKIEDLLVAKAYPGVKVPGFMRLKEYMLGFDEQLCLVDNFKNYFATRLYERTSEVEGAIDMNRHSVLHGLSMDFNKPINFYRLFIMLVFLAFVSVLLGHSRASSFVEETERSKLKSGCYDTLAAFGASMKVRFPL